MVIDDNKVSHAFITGNIEPSPLPPQSCLLVKDHSELVAEKAKSLIEDIILGNKR